MKGNTMKNDDQFRVIFSERINFLTGFSENSALRIISRLNSGINENITIDCLFICDHCKDKMYIPRPVIQAKTDRGNFIGLAITSKKDKICRKCKTYFVLNNNRFWILKKEWWKEYCKKESQFEIENIDIIISDLNDKSIKSETIENCSVCKGKLEDWNMKCPKCNQDMRCKIP